MNYVIYASFSHWSIDFNNLKIVTNSKFGNKLVPDQKVGKQNPLIVWVFKHSELKFTNIPMLKFHIRLCLTPNTKQSVYKES